MINPIGNHVLSEACRHCKSWNDNGYPDYKVNVNLSVVQLLQNDIVEIIDRTLKETGLQPKNLTLEVTESLAINDMERMKDILRKIKELGVDMALDDFGTGYSSLMMLKSVPIDEIKLDKSFVDDYSDAKGSSIIRCVLDLAKMLQLPVVAEGVETENQYHYLRQMGCDVIQGYYFSKPLPVLDFVDKLA